MEAKTARTGTAMVLTLVKASFSAKRLQRSCYAGQSRTINGVKSQKPGLKKYQKMRDIQGKIIQFKYLLGVFCFC